MITLVLDPGAKGAIAVFDDLTVINILSIPQAKWGAKQTLPDTKQVSAIFKQYNPEIIVIERVTSAPTDGRVSASNFLHGLGRLEGCSSDYRLEYIRPQIWKVLCGLRNSDKKASIAKALELHPEAKPFLTGQKNTNDRADSVCMGHAFLKYKEKLR